MILQLQGFPVQIGDLRKPAETQNELRVALNVIRWILLNESDWTQLTDTGFSQELRNEWVQFRQYIRDLSTTIPEVIGNTFTITSPPSNHPSSWVNLTANTSV